MTSAALAAPLGSTGWRALKADSLAWPLIVAGLLLAGQFWLIFAKSFNWDEFLHFSKVYQLQSGTLTSPFQTLLARALVWAPHISGDLMTQMIAGRILAWSAFVLGLGAIYGLALRFVSREDAAWATLVYFGVGAVFSHGFAIRSDPIAMAALMLALYLLACHRLGWRTVLAAGVLVGFAGMLTVKSAFYAPCFAGIAWLRFREAADQQGTLIRLGAVAPVAAVTFASIFVLHRAGLAPTPSYQQGGAFLANGAQWLTQGLLQQPKYTMLAMVTAPVFVIALIKSPATWRTSDLGRDRLIALAAFCVPLVVILFYRNVFPYFFVFILAPVAVALAPTVAQLRRSYGTPLLTLAIIAVPIAKIATEPRDVLDHQRAIVAYVHRTVPTGAMGFDYSGMVADHPTAIHHLLSGIGLANYNARGIPLIARAVESGQLAFVIENRADITLALEGETRPGGLLPADVAALHGNFARAWGPIWLQGKRIPAGADPYWIQVAAAGAYTPDAPVTIDGAPYSRGTVATLSKGQHLVTGTRDRQTVLWRGKRLPAPAPDTAVGPAFTQF